MDMIGGLGGVGRHTSAYGMGVHDLRTDAAEGALGGLPPTYQLRLPASRSSLRKPSSRSAILASTPRGAGSYQCGSRMPSGR